MIEIEIDNSYSKVKNMTREAYLALRKELSYQTDAKAAYFGGFGPRTNYLIDKHGNYPTGLTHRIERLFKDQGTTYKLIKPLYKSGFGPRINANTDPTRVPYHDQEKAVSQALMMKRGIVSMPTGTGKSKVIEMLLLASNVRTLIIVPNLELKAQLTKQLEEVSLLHVGFTVENIDSPLLKNANDFDMLIIDEAHHVAAKTYRSLNKTTWTKIRYRFFFTATPFRNQSEEQLLFESIAGQVIYKLTYQEAISKGYIVPVEAYYIELPKQATDAHTWSQVYSQLVVNNKARNELIAKILASLKEPTLCLVKEIAHGKILEKLTGVPFANGQDEYSRHYINLFSIGEIPSLIGTIGVIGEGVDTKPCEYVIIAGLGKAKSSFMQQIGRSVRKFADKKSAKVLLFADKSHKFTARHFNEQKKICIEEYGVTPIKLDLTSD
jgi:superfamily II DNA or RNA helicase